jgi:hypothetical protein
MSAVTRASLAGKIEVGQSVSRAIVTKENADTPIVEGDYSVSLDKWQYYHAD